VTFPILFRLCPTLISVSLYPCHIHFPLFRPQFPFPLFPDRCVRCLRVISLPAPQHFPPLSPNSGLCVLCVLGKALTRSEGSNCLVRVLEVSGNRLGVGVEGMVGGLSAISLQLGGSDGNVWVCDLTELCAKQDSACALDYTLLSVPRPPLSLFVSPCVFPFFCSPDFRLFLLGLGHFISWKCAVCRVGCGCPSLSLVFFLLPSPQFLSFLFHLLLGLSTGVLSARVRAREHAR